MIAGQISKMIGSRVKRKEDPRLITGEGKFTDDVILPGMAYMAVLRSPYAHARILSIDTAEAAAHPDVLGVMTGAEVNERCSEPFPLFAILPGMQYPKRWPMAATKANYVGEPVAAVVATSRAAARDALDLIEVDYEPLPVVTDMEKAADADAPVIFEELGSNLCYEASDQAGDPDRAFAEADGVVEARMEQPRLIPNPMETRATVADYERSSGNATLWVTTQNPHIERMVVAQMLGMPENKLRVVAIDVGGGFGCKINTYSESIIAIALAERIGRPVKWAEDRTEHFVATSHGRGQAQYVQAAYKKDGTLLGMKLKIYADLGAYAQVISHVIPTLTPSLAPGVYACRDIGWTTIGVFTNKIPYDAYRGAGRPEAAYIIERVIDLIADATGKDPVAVRRKNFIPKDSFPYETPTGMIYDSADYDAALDKALAIADYDNLRAEQKSQRKDGRIVGIGVTVTTEVCGFGPAAAMGGLGGFESATVRVDPMGKVTVLTGASPHGQGEETSFAQIVADDLGVAFEDVEVIHGDTSIVARGVGTFGSRTLVVGGTAILKANEQIKEKATRIATALLENKIGDTLDPQLVTLEDGMFAVQDMPDQYVTWADVGSEAYDGQLLPEDLDPGLEAVSFWEPPGLTFPFSAHIAVVEIDPDIGEVSLKRYVSVDDCGTVINPTLVEGQIHGGLAQGIGQALLEQAVWDDEGQLVSGSLMDYAMPFAQEFPMFELDRTVTPSPVNPLGAKGIGEMATISATPTVANAVVDALSPLGVTHVDIPMTGERIWRVLQKHGRSGRGGRS
jgi:carbon-monoxide dehydrogenase large subunit